MKTQLMKTWVRLRIALVMVFALVAVAVLVRTIDIDWTTARFPGEHWEHIAPERAGFVSDLLAEFVGEVGGHGLVVRNGCVVTRWGHYAHPLDVASACKPVYAHFVYAAIKDDLIQDLDEKVSLYGPDLDLISGYGEITWRHLLQQTAGYGVEELPGTAFNYCDYQAALLVDTMVQKLHNTSYSRADEDILQEYLAGPLGFQDKATINHKRSLRGRLRISARDFVRFGLLYLNKGKWDGRQIIPREVAIQAVTSPHPPDLPRTDQVEVQMLQEQRSFGAGANLESHMGSYSYTWWVNGEIRKDHRLFPGLPIDMFLAQGRSGRNVLLVIPSLDLVACWINAFPEMQPAESFSMEGRERVYAAARKLLSAMIKPDAANVLNEESNY